MKEHSHHRPSDDEAIEATAAAWLAQRDDGFSPGEDAEFMRWRAADSRHEAAVGRLEETWGVLQRLREFRPEARLHPDRDLLRPRGARRLIPFPVVAGAVGMAAALAFAAVWWIAPVEHVQPETRKAGIALGQNYTTTVDGYQRIMLEDGSVVELNSSSEVNVQYTLSERGVRLVRGEAHFTVAKDSARPFSVEAGTVAMRAVGTAFNVRLTTDRVEVLVTEGTVHIGAAPEHEVEPLHSGAIEATGDVRQLQVASLLLAANERAIIATAFPGAAPAFEPTAVERVKPEAIREALAWHGPRLVFVDTPLGEAIEQFNRRNPVQLELADPALAKLAIGGSFRAENVEAFVRLLASGGEVSVERPDPLRIVLRRAE